MKNSIFILILFVGLVAKAQTELQLDKLAIGNIPLSSLPPFAKVWIEGGGHPQIFLNNPSNPANKRLWIMGVIGDEFRIMTENDNYSAVKMGMIMKRTNDINIDYVSFPEGNFGIGTTNPQEKFQIGNTYTFHDGGHKVIGFLYKPSGGVDLSTTQYSSEIRFDPDNGKFFLGTSNTITSNPTAKLTIDNQGYVGVGTTSPTEKLDVNGKTVVNSLKIDSNNATPSVNGFSNRIEFTGGGHGAIVFHSGAADELMFGLHNNGNFYWGTGRSATKPDYYSMFLNGNNGDLGIKGKLTSNEVKVKLGGWADFVFENTYDLPSLEEVELYINEKGHLKDIPSAQEVEENGIHLGEMNAKLLQKIEELTLYIIEQDKQLKEQKEKNKEVEERLKKLEKLILKQK